ncbi:MAG: ATP-dependent Clp protease proteolytic subunit, partial [Acidimicrobiales bacterium]|nr:ATP-dependent Clp protease proteolytic subunit [Acidimicrobiales bacterium]
RLKTQLEEVLSSHTGQEVEKIHADTDRDFVMTAQEAKEYGIIDEVIDSREMADNSGAITVVT